MDNEIPWVYICLSMIIIGFVLGRRAAQKAKEQQSSSEKANVGEKQGSTDIEMADVDNESELEILKSQIMIERKNV